MTTEEKKAEANRKRAESMRRAWATGKGTLNTRIRREQRPCKCGCGKLAALDNLYAKGHYDPGAAHRGKTHSKEWREKQSAGVAAACRRGAYAECCKRRREKTLTKRRKCQCGCGNPVERAGAKYYRDHFIPKGKTAEVMSKLRQMRDMKKLRADSQKRLKDQMEKWKASGKLDDIRRKAGNARGMLDHLAAKVWNIRDPFGNPHKFSNLSEWARQNCWRFEDDRPQSTAPFWKRIAGGITDLLKANGRSCSYRGWTAISKLEIEEGGADLLGRDYFLQNDQAHRSAPGGTVERNQVETK